MASPGPGSQTVSVALLGMLAVLGLGAHGQERDRQAPVPVDAIKGIADALRSYAVIGLSAGEGHGDARGPAFLISLIQDSRITAFDLNIVMEAGNARYQSTMDRYVEGDDVPAADLARIWNESTQQQVPGPTWSGDVPPVYKAIRAVNMTLPPPKHIRALLGDPPIEWEHVTTHDEFQQWLALRDSFPAELIQREVVAQGGHAIVEFGGGHLQRKQQLSNYEMNDPLEQTIISLVERAGTKAFVITTGMDRDGMSGWPYPSLALLRGTTIGGQDEAIISPQRVRPRDGKLVPIPREEWISMKREDQADALLYLGPESTKTDTPVPTSICDDKDYIQIRLQRMAIAGLPPSEPEHLRKLCGL